MKATLNFDFDDPEKDDRDAFQDAIDGTKWKFLVWELDQHLRNKTKYAIDDDDPKVIEALYELRDYLHSLKDEKRLRFD
jgi:hypothetical protein